uniref:NADH dehydrogenase subunit 5 n=1 Tax=Craseoa lathetica TaxID=316205 RepID=UPI0026E41718|nr:NADH dehydrogenase subunit 5 [Craseoa lathetica]WJJ70147.1 NADH dehydrogenase subunit 5 [Craseoa lathetica]
MYLLLLYSSILNFFICGCFGRQLGYKGILKLLFFSFFILLCSNLNLFNELICHENIINLPLYLWFNCGILSNPLGFYFDKITLTMFLLISIVSFCVHLYSFEYMKEEPHLIRFISYLSLFTFFMFILISANNLIQLFIGWEGVGLCSYLLINFWFTRIKANKAAIEALIVNKVGDIGLLLALIYLWKISGLTLYNNLFSLYSTFIFTPSLNYINFLLLIAIMGKSAQIGLHMWLPNAMEGPTPVSALIHAATMVTAGVFLIIRCSSLFEQTPLILLLIIFIGSLTTFSAATIGLVQNDLKKVIAYSTCSQLGYMVVISGFSFYDVSLFHLFNHGFFKALLFLSAGSIIHTSINEQDFRKMGHLIIATPFTYISMLIGSLSLIGLPFLSGYYSKDLLLELIYQKHFIGYALWLTLITTLITSFYSFKLLINTFFSIPFYNKILNTTIHEGKNKLLIPLLILLILSIMSGFCAHLFILNINTPLIILNFYKLLPTLCGFIGAYWMWSKIRINLNKFFTFIYNFLIKLYYFDHLISHFIVKTVLGISFSFTYKLLDNQLLEKMGPSSITNTIRTITSKISSYHNGKLTSYTWAFIFFFIVILFIYI